MRQILLNDKRLNLPKDVEESLRGYKDLQGFSGVPEMDPLNLFDKFYKRDIDKLDVLDDIIDIADNERDAAKKFLQREKFDIKEKDLGDKLKDLPDDIDPDAMAEGGRPGYAYGSAKAIITFIIESLVKKKKFDPGLLKRVSEQKNGEKLLKELYEKEIGELPLTTADNIPQPKKTLKSIEETGSIDISNDEIAEEFANFMKRNDPEGYEKLKGMTDKINSKTRTDNAQGGLSYLMGM